MPKYRTVERDEGATSAKRVYAVGAFFALCFGVLASRAVGFHLKNNDELEKVALRQYRTAVREHSMRGKIVDKNGRDLAIDITADSLFANPQEIVDSVEAVSKLAEILDVDRKRLLDKLSSKRKFVWIKRRADDEEVAEVKALGLEGIYTMKESLRSYPNGTVGASVLGAVGFDAEPLGGLELQYDDVLSSRSKTHEIRRDARGHLYLSPSGGEKASERQNIRLTVDKTLQYIADSELAKGVDSARAEGGEAVVVDVRTGAILAMANVPTFDPNEYSKYPLSHWRNSVIVEPHEPGSTFKVIVVSAALNAGVVSYDEEFDCENGQITIGKDVVRDSHPHDMLSVADIIKVSSNIGTYKIESRLGRERVYDAVRDFGFGRKTSIDLPGEAAGILTHYDKWSPIQFATIAFGQGMAATSLQMAMAFAAIANGGRLMKPYIVDAVMAEDGSVISETKPEVVATPIGSDVAGVVRDILEMVVEVDGTGMLAASVDYRMAGKTGTAQKVDPRTGTYAKNRYFASFVGFAPAENPRIAVFVGLNEPKGAYYGGQVAAPVFRRIVEKTLRYLKVPASKTSAGRTIVASQMPEMQTVEDVPPVVTSEDEPRQVTRHDEKSWRLPDFRGMTMRAVLAASGDAEIEWNFQGSGIAVRQWPEPGSVLAAGDLCRVEFKPLI